jgi:hypothetical protein
MTPRLHAGGINTRARSKDAHHDGADVQEFGVDPDWDEFGGTGFQFSNGMYAGIHAEDDRETAR